MLISVFITLVVLCLFRASYKGVSICPFQASHMNEKYSVEFDQLRMIPVQKYTPSQLQGPKQLIPYNIFQTNEYNQVPSDMAMSIDTVRQNNPQYSYHYYNSTQRRQFIKSHMDATILACYDKLIPNAYKADLFRYSVVYTYGGCYFDIGFIFVGHLRDSVRGDDTFISTLDSIPPRLAVNSAFFCSTPNNTILGETIKAIVRRVANEEYGEDNIDVTGPRTFAKGFKEHFRNGSLELKSGEYPGGVRLFERTLRDPSCIMWQLLDPFKNLTLIFHKYPRYFEDTGVYSHKLHYSVLYQDKHIYDTSIKVPSSPTYPTTPTQQPPTF